MKQKQIKTPEKRTKFPWLITLVTLNLFVLTNFMTEESQTACESFPCSQTPFIQSCLVGTELSGSHVKAPYEPGGWGVVCRSVWKPAELKGAEYLWESCAVKALVIFGHKTMDPVVMSPLTYCMVHLTPTIKTPKLVMLIMSSFSLWPQSQTHRPV